MVAIRFAFAALASALLSTSYSTCRGSADTSAGTAPGSGALASGVAARDVELPGVDTSSLTPRERREWSQAVSELLSPCNDVAVPIAQCIREKRACSRCLPAAKHLVRLVLASGGTKEIVYDRYKKRFDADRVKNVDTSDTPMKGAATAPVTIVEWADFQCPFCKNASPILEEEIGKFPGKVRLFFKNYPLPMHPLAEQAARAAIAAGNQGKFWEMHHKLYEASPDIDQTGIEKAAKELGLKLDQLKADMASEATTARLAREKKEANSLGLTGTPLIFINGREFPLGNDFQAELEEWIRMDHEMSGASLPDAARVAPSAPAPATRASAPGAPSGSASKPR